MKNFFERIILNKFRLTGVALKFILCVLGFLIPCMVILAITSVRRETTNSVKYIENETRVMTRAFAIGLGNRVSDIEPSVLLDRITAMRRLTSVVFVRVFDEKGKNIVSSDSEFEGEFLKNEVLDILKDKGLVIHRSSYAGNNIFETVVSLDKYSQQGGFIKLGYSTDLLELRISETYRYLILITAGLILASILASYIISWVISKPLLQLAAGTERVRSGDLDSEVEIKTRDEFYDLADSFNHMVASLKKSKQELEGYQLMLEKKVQERTRELSLANMELRRLDRLKMEFVTYVIHELQTPLAIMRESITLLTDGTFREVDSTSQKLLEINKHNIMRISRLVANVLDFSKMKTGKFSLNRLQNELNPIIVEVIQMMRFQAERKGTSLEYNLADNLPPVILDKEKITQVIINLLHNAIKFTPKGGKIRVESDLYQEKPSDDIYERIKVSDTGLGIKPEEISKLFQEFEQLDSSKKSGAGGAGLGLAISKDIVEAHKGKIWAKSPIIWLKDGGIEEKKGSRFTFILPLTP